MQAPRRDTSIKPLNFGANRLIIRRVKRGSKVYESISDIPAQQAAIYVRISKDREGDELGVERQIEDCQKIATRLGLSVYRIYKDNDLSGSKYARKVRPEYIAMLEHARAGYFSTIIAYTSSRLTRRPREHEDQIELAEQNDITYRFVRSPEFDLNTAGGRLIARILAAKDANEAEETSERITRTKLQRAEMGCYLGGYRAYGYEGAQYDEDGSITNRGRINIAIVQHEAETFRLIVQRVLVGERIATIVNDLNAQGVPSPDGKQWDYGNTKRILLKKRYVIFDDSDPEKRGTLEHNGQTYRAQWQGLIDRQTYELMLSRFEENANSWKRGLTNGRVYLLSGVAYCECGTACYGNGRKMGNGQYQRRYRCRSQDNHGNRLGCGKGFRGAEPLEDYVTEQALAKLERPEILNALTSKSDDSRTGELLTKLTNQREHRKRLVIEYGEGLHSRQDYKLMLDAADNAIALTQAELAKARSGEGSRLIPGVRSIRDLWPDASIEWQREVIRLVVEQVVIKPGRPGSKLYKTWRFNTNHVEIIWRDVTKAELVAALSALLSSAHPLDIGMELG